MTEKKTVLSLAGIFLLALVLRLLFLGESAFRADTIEFYRLALQNQDPLSLWKNPPWWNQSPLAESSMLWFLKLFSLGPTPFHVRLLFALVGSATVFPLYFFMREVFDSRIGLISALLGAASPFHVYTSREAYHYSFLLFFSTLALAFFWRLWKKLSNKEVVPLKYVLFFGLASVGACQAHMAAWMPFFVQGLVLVFAAVRGFTDDRRALARVLGSLMGMAVVVLLTLWSWLGRVYTYVIENPDPLSALVSPGAESGFSRALKQFIPVYTFGLSPVGVLLIVVIVGLGVWACCSTPQYASALKRMVLVLGLEFAIVVLLMKYGGKGFGASRYFTPLWPILMGFITIFLVAIGSTLSVRLFRGRHTRSVVCACVGGLLLFWAMPTWAVLRLEGKPKPYHKLAHTIEEHLPPGGLVLVDRWYEAIVEMRLYAPSNRYVTFTVPNEPFEAFKQNRWRETAKEFFQRFPQAGYLEVRKTYFEVPEIGFWDWPRTHFKQHVRIENKAGMVLRKWGLAPREDFYEANTNGLLNELFYNTKEDILELAKEANRSSIVLFGEGWGYTKTQDYKDWRILTEKGEVGLYNLTADPLSIKLVVEGVAIEKAKQVEDSKQHRFEFKPNQLLTWEIGPIHLPSGETCLYLEDREWSRAQVPLLVQSMTILEAEK